MDFYKAMADKTLVSAPCNCTDDTCNLFVGTLMVVNYYDMRVRIKNDRGLTGWFSMDLVTPALVSVTI